MNKFYITGEVDELVVQPLLDFLRENEEEDVVLHIDSIGGDVFAGLRIIQAIENHKGQVIAECGIIVASIASVIALSCNRLTITKDTFMMIHKPWCVVCGTAEELLSTAALLEQSGKRIQEICKNKAKEETDASSWFVCDTWFGYEEILNSFNDVELQEETEVNTKVLSLTNKLKTAPDSLIAIAAKLQEVEEETVVEDNDTKNDSEETDTETDNSGEDSEVSSEEVSEVEEEVVKTEEKEKEEETVNNELAISVINKLTQLNIC